MIFIQIDAPTYKRMTCIFTIFGIAFVVLFGMAIFVASYMVRMFLTW